MRTVVLHGKVLDGAGEDEQDVFVQAAAISQALSELGYDPITLPLSLNIAETMDVLRSLNPAFVFNLVEAIEGKGNMIHFSPILLDTLKIPYTGAQAEAIFLTSSKLSAKKILRLHGIPTPEWLPRDGQWPAQLKEAKYIVKSAWEHASVGLDEGFVVYTADIARLREQILVLQSRLGGNCFSEEYIEGREMNVSLLAGPGGVEVLPPAEIIFEDYPPDKERMLCYRSKWVEDSFEYEHTPRTFDFAPGDHGLLQEVTAIARRCWEIFELRGYARVDFRVDEAMRPFVLEINANPCIAPEGGFVAAARQRGLDYTTVIRRIVDDIPGVKMSHT